jgi:thioredoxin-related protein
MIKKTVLAFVVALTLVIAPLAAVAGETAGRIGWLTYDAAKAKGENQSQKYFIYFSSRNCGYCRMLESKTFSNTDVSAYINENYIPVQVDIDKERKIAASFGIRGVPDLRFLARDGATIGRWIGFTEADHLLQLLKYVQTDSYLTMSFNDFAKK